MHSTFKSHNTCSILHLQWELNLNWVPFREGTMVTSCVVRMSQTAALITTRCPEEWKAADTPWSATARRSKRCTTVADRTSNRVYPHCDGPAKERQHTSTSEWGKQGAQVQMVD